MTVLNTSDGTDLFVQDWTVEDPIAAVALFHGWGEHAARYAHVAKAFAAHRIALVGADLRGHGRSSGDRGYIDRFSDYYLDATAIFEKAQSVVPGGPTFVFAHSMGGLLAFDWMLSGFERAPAGMVVSSPFMEVAVPVGLVKEKVGRLASKIAPKLALPTGLQGSDVTRDPELARLYDTDPLNLKKATARWFTECEQAQARVRARIGKLSTPLLLLYGGSDRAVQPDATERLARDLTMSDKTVERLDGHYHELVNEPPEVREPIIERMAEWIAKRATNQG